MDLMLGPLLLLMLGPFVVVMIVAADRTRYLVRYDLQSWHDTYYLRALPNFLQALHDARLPMPFPGHLNAVAATLFRFRTWPIMRARPSLVRRNFLRHHLAFQALIFIHRSFVDDAILGTQQRIVSRHIQSMEDTADRDRLIAFCRRAEEQRRLFAASLTLYDRTIIAALVRRRFFPTLRAAHAIFQEHGYALMEELSELRLFESLSPAELVQVLPPLPKSLRVRQPRSRRAAEPS